MAIVRRGSVQIGGGGPVTSAALTIPASVVAGDLLILTSMGQGAVTYDLTKWTAVRAYQDNGNVRSGCWIRQATGADAGATLTFTQSLSTTLVVTLAAYGGAALKGDAYTANWGGASSPFNSSQVVNLGSADVLYCVAMNNQVASSPTMNNAGTQQALLFNSSSFSGTAYESTAGGTPTPQEVFGSGSYAQIDAVVLTSAGTGTPVIYTSATLAATRQGRPSRILKGRQSAALDDAAVA